MNKVMFMHAYHTPHWMAPFRIDFLHFFFVRFGCLFYCNFLIIFFLGNSKNVIITGIFCLKNYNFSPKNYLPLLVVGCAINLCLKICFTFCSQQMGLSLSHSHKLCHLNMKYCSGTITCIFIDVRWTSKRTHSHAHTLWLSSSCPFVFPFQNNVLVQKTHKLTFKAYQKAMDSFFFQFFHHMFSTLVFHISCRFFPSLIYSLLVFVLHFSTFSWFTTQFNIARGTLPRAACTYVCDVWCMLYVLYV